MRKSYESKLIQDNNGLIGINLGSDMCAEHEWGIKDIKDCLGIDDSLIGLEKRKISSVFDEYLKWFENLDHDDGNGKWSGFWFGKIYSSPYFDGRAFGKDIFCQWDEKGFCVLSNNEKIIKKLKQIYDAFASNDIAVWVGGGGPFKNGGLCIAIASKLPKAIVNAWEKADLEKIELDKEVEKTGIISKLYKAGKRYHCLKAEKFEGELKFWLNPCEQDKNNYGWYTVKDLESWIIGKGPIPKKR